MFYFLKKLSEFQPFDLNDRLERWALKASLKSAAVVIPNDPDEARREFCHYLGEALNESNSWLGIHEDRVEFFTERSRHADELAQYELALRNWEGRKARVFVVNKENRDDFLSEETMRQYFDTLKHYESKLDSYLLMSHNLDDFEIPTSKNKRFTDWALYDSSLLLEFDDARKLIRFHRRSAEDLVKSMATMLAAVHDEHHELRRFLIPMDAKLEFRKRL
jgi:hypothetical protein